MDAISDITEKLSLPVLKDFLSENAPQYVQYLVLMEKELNKVQIFMKTTNFRAHSEDKRQALVEGVRLTVRKVANFMRKIVPNASNKKLLSYNIEDLVKELKETIDFIVGIVVFCNYLKQTETENEMENQDIDEVVKCIETLNHDAPDISNAVDRITQNVKSEAILLKNAFPDHLGEPKESSEKKKFLVGLSKELDILPQLICKACDGQSLALHLIGGLLSFKQMTYDTWDRVNDELGKIKGKYNCVNGKAKESDNHATDDHMLHIFNYCYDDLPYYLKPCFLYLACYPIGYEIPARSLIEIWIAEGFVTPEKGETREETADKYLEQLVHRSLVCVSKRSSLGTIKYCKVPALLHQFAIQQSNNDGFLVANPDKETMESLFRLAIHGDNKEQYMEVENNHIHSFLAFDFDRNILGSAVFLKVLESRKSAVPVTALSNMTDLRYLRLRGTTISELPDIGDFKNLQTLDVRDTKIKTLPESLWNISSLRHVYVMPSAKIEGPPAESKIEDLQIMKTVEVPKSWLKIAPHFLINLRKLALSNQNDWKSVSNLLSILVKLLSLAIIGETIPSEFVDTRAFPNLETVKSIKLEGKWKCRKLFIDNVKFPPNLTKLTLAKSDLKEDPMPKLEKLQALKYLSLQEEAYSGKKMVCSAKGFPQLQQLKLSELKNLDSWVVEEDAMPQLHKLHIDRCTKLREIPHLPAHITDKVIDY